MCLPQNASTTSPTSDPVCTLCEVVTWRAGKCQCGETSCNAPYTKRTHTVPRTSNESRERFFSQVSASLCFPAHRYKRSQQRSEDAGPSRFVWPSFQSFQTGLAHSFLCFLCPIVQYGPVHFCFRHEAWPTQLMRRHNKDACPGVLTTT